MRLSVVLGTYNRIYQLLRCIRSIYKYSPDSEIVVVDGGSTDGTLEWLRTQSLTLIEQGELLGAVKAFNAGFAIAHGEYVANLNDDAWLVDQGFWSACNLLDDCPEAGQVAIPFDEGRVVPFRLDATMPLAGRRWLYANFGVTRRTLGNRLGWWGTDYYTYGGDAEISMKIWNAGYQVIPLHGFRVMHEEVRDGLRRPNTDSPLFYAKWREWTGPGDPDPRFN